VECYAKIPVDGAANLRMLKEIIKLRDQMPPMPMQSGK
jgi:hypothetical protein